RAGIDLWRTRLPIRPADQLLASIRGKIINDKTVSPDRLALPRRGFEFRFSGGIFGRITQKPRAFAGFGSFDLAFFVKFDRNRYFSGKPHISRKRWIDRTSERDGVALRQRADADKFGFHGRFRDLSFCLLGRLRRR